MRARDVICNRSFEELVWKIIQWVTKEISWHHKSLIRIRLWMGGYDINQFLEVLDLGSETE